MYGILFIYFIGRMFYRLAIEFRQNKWLYTVLGILVYYGGAVMFGVFTGIVLFFILTLEEDLSELVINLVCLAGGIAVCWGFYKILESKWKKLPVLVAESIDEIGLAEEEPETLIVKP